MASNSKTKKLRTTNNWSKHSPAAGVTAVPMFVQFKRSRSPKVTNVGTGLGKCSSRRTAAQYVGTGPK